MHSWLLPLVASYNMVSGMPLTAILLVAMVAAQDDGTVLQAQAADLGFCAVLVPRNPAAHRSAAQKPRS